MPVGIILAVALGGSISKLLDKSITGGNNLVIYYPTIYSVLDELVSLLEKTTVKAEKRINRIEILLKIINNHGSELVEGTVYNAGGIFNVVRNSPAYYTNTSLLNTLCERAREIVEDKTYGRLSNLSSRSIHSSFSDLGASSEFEMIGNEEILKDISEESLKLILHTDNKKDLPQNDPNYTNNFMNSLFKKYKDMINSSFTSQLFNDKLVRNGLSYNLSCQYVYSFNTLNEIYKRLGIRNKIYIMAKGSGAAFNGIMKDLTSINPPLPQRYINDTVNELKSFIGGDNDVSFYAKKGVKVDPVFLKSIHDDIHNFLLNDFQNTREYAAIIARFGRHMSFSLNGKDYISLLCNDPNGVYNYPVKFVSPFDKESNFLCPIQFEQDGMSSRFFLFRIQIPFRVPDLGGNRVFYSEYIDISIPCNDPGNEDYNYKKTLPKLANINDNMLYYKSDTVGNFLHNYNSCIAEL